MNIFDLDASILNSMSDVIPCLVDPSLDKIVELYNRLNGREKYNVIKTIGALRGFGEYQEELNKAFRSSVSGEKK